MAAHTSSALPRPKAWTGAVGLAIYLKFLLEPTGWLFYELYHATGVDAIYWGYTVFRGVGVYFNAWEYQNTVCIAVALLILAIAWWRAAQ